MRFKYFITAIIVFIIFSITILNYKNTNIFKKYYSSTEVSKETTKETDRKIDDRAIKNATPNNKKFKNVLIENSKNSLFIPTYEHSNQSNHPKVLYFKDGWNKYKYWMTFTPYPNSIERHENPCVLTSNDGISWKAPLGIKNPIISPPTDVNLGGHYSDPALIFDSKTNSLELWYRYTKGFKKNIASNKDSIFRIKSKDGVNWSKLQLVYKKDTVSCISPAIIYENNIYKMWYVTYDPQLKVVYTESTDALNWSDIKTVNLNFYTDFHPWHIDITRTDKGYEMLVSNYFKRFGNNILSYSLSSNGIDFSIPKTILKPSSEKSAWDNKMIYKSSLVKVDSKYKIYYSAMSEKSKWHIGLSEIDSSFLTD